MSTSLRGRELKDPAVRQVHAGNRVDLLERSWIERIFSISAIFIPLVDLLERSWIERSFHMPRCRPRSCRPPWEVVNWKINYALLAGGFETSTSLRGRELKEYKTPKINNGILSTSLRGRELKGRDNGMTSDHKVDLLERSWIESSE